MIDVKKSGCKSKEWKERTLFDLNPCFKKGENPVQLHDYKV